MSGTKIGGTPQAYHIFRDPIHGFIRVYECEKCIIDSLPFQRLRQIRQLGLCNLVYHGAEHTRFGHSLGVMEFATRIFDTLRMRHGRELAERFGWGEDDFERNRQKLRLEALLHDIGHAPFSHATEGLFPKAEDHETYTLKIVKSEPICQIISRFSGETGIALDDILELLGKSPLEASDNFLKAILAGEVGADRMDYLLRDSLYTGVQYGKFDSDRLIETLCLVERPDGNPDIGIEERGKHASEGLILARYFMFTQVYFHVLRRIYDIHLSRLIKEMFQQESITWYPDNADDYLAWDDIRVLTYARHEFHKGTSRDAEAIVARKHYECVRETREHTEREPEEVYKFEAFVNKLRARYGDERIVEDISDKAPYGFKESELQLRKRTSVVSQ